MEKKVLYLFLVVCSALPFAHSHTWSTESVRSNRFESLRPKHAPKQISECDIVITEAYGQLEKTYKRSEAKVGQTCSWTLRAPANHVVNVISVAFDLEDKTSTEPHYNDYSGSLIEFYDGADSAKTVLTQYTVNDHQHVGAFVSSITKKPEMLVKVTFRDNVDYATQKLYIKYEFLNVDDMNRLLRQ